MHKRREQHRLERALITLALCMLFASLIVFYERQDLPFRDTANYEFAFDQIIDGTLYPIEPFHYLLAYVADFLGAGNNFVLCAYGAMTIALMAPLFYRFGFLFLLVYVSFYGFLHIYTQVRVGLAIALVYNSIYIENDRRLRLILQIAAPFVHISSLLLVAAIRLSDLRYSSRQFKKFILIFFVTGLVAKVLTPYLLQDRYGLYLAQAITFRFALVYFVAILAFAYFGRQKGADTPLFRRLLVLDIVIFITFYEFQTISARFRELFGVVECYFIINSAPSKLFRYAVSALFILFFLYTSFFSEYKIFDIW